MPTDPHQSHGGRSKFGKWRLKLKWLVELNRITYSEPAIMPVWWSLQAMGQQAKSIWIASRSKGSSIRGCRVPWILRHAGSRLCLCCLWMQPASKLLLPFRILALDIEEALESRQRTPLHYCRRFKDGGQDRLFSLNNQRFLPHTCHGVPHWRPEWPEAQTSVSPHDSSTFHCINAHMVTAWNPKARWQHRSHPYEFLLF